MVRSTAFPSRNSSSRKFHRHSRSWHSPYCRANPSCHPQRRLQTSSISAAGLLNQHPGCPRLSAAPRRTLTTSGWQGHVGAAVDRSRPEPAVVTRKSDATGWVSVSKGPAGEEVATHNRGWRAQGLRQLSSIARKERGRKRHIAPHAGLHAFHERSRPA